MPASPDQAWFWSITVPLDYAGEGCDERACTNNRSGEAGFPKELVRLDRLVIALTDFDSDALAPI